MVGMGWPGTSPKSESFTCNWFDRLLPSRSLLWACFISVTPCFPKPTSHGARQNAKESCFLFPSCVISAPTGPTRLPASDVSTPNNLSHCQGIRVLQCCLFLFRSSISVLRPLLGEREKSLRRQLLKEQMGKKRTDECNASSSNISPLKYTKLFCFVFLISTLGLTFPICLCIVF